MEYLIQDEEFDFTTKDMVNIRNTMRQELKNRMIINVDNRKDPEEEKLGSKTNKTTGKFQTPSSKDT